MAIKRGGARNDPAKGLVHRGGKKLEQHGVESFHKAKETRQHPPRGYRGKRG